MGQVEQLTDSLNPAYQKRLTLFLNYKKQTQFKPTQLPNQDPIVRSGFPLKCLVCVFRIHLIYILKDSLIYIQEYPRIYAYFPACPPSAYIESLAHLPLPDL